MLIPLQLKINKLRDKQKISITDLVLSTKLFDTFPTVKMQRVCVLCMAGLLSPCYARYGTNPSAHAVKEKCSCYFMMGRFTFDVAGLEPQNAKICLCD